jgi:DNA-binding transcriptional regulator GbsR (MarR family)
MVRPTEGAQVAPSAVPVEDPDEFRFVDELGLLWEVSSGTPRMAGRILGALLEAEEPYLSGTELAERLNASSGSVSTMTRLLEGQGVIERFVRPGSRRDYFRLVQQPWRANLQHAAAITQRYVALLDRALRSMGDGDTAARRRVSELRDFYAFWNEEWPRLIERYEQTRAASD